MKLSVTTLLLCFSLTISAAIKSSEGISMPDSLESLKNYQVNSATMISAGLPSENEFKALKSLGVTHVIDLIPGDRSDENSFMDSLGLKYFNVQVEWQNPSLQNFQDYVSFMNTSQSAGGITLTHCKLNWRGAVFTYLYQVTQLDIPEDVARQDMEVIWEPNRTWRAFIDDVKAHYATK
jgi:hypothetical protein